MGRLPPLGPAAKPGGRPEKYAKREIINGIFTASEVGVRGASYPMSCRPGVALITISACGETTGLGNAFMIDYEVIGASSKGARASPQCRQHRFAIGQNDRSRR